MVKKWNQKQCRKNVPNKLGTLQTRLIANKVNIINWTAEKHTIDNDQPQ